MEFLLTVTGLYIAYQISVNTNSRRERETMQEQINALKEKIFEANQHYEMILLYGKARKTEETFQEEERLIQENEGQCTGQASYEALDEQ